jgi:hypothetical protein
LLRIALYRALCSLVDRRNLGRAVGIDFHDGRPELVDPFIGGRM